MALSRLAILAFAVLAVAGCHTTPAERATYDAYQEELRRYEGIIYDLEYNNETLCQENDRLKKQLTTGRPERKDDGPGIFPPRRDTRSPAAPPSDAPDLSPPVIEMDESPDEPPASPRRPPPPSATQKPVSPAEEDAEKPAAELDPPREDDAPDEVPPVPRSILTPKVKPKTPVTAPSEVLPPPTNQNPTSHPTTPELLPEPEDKRVSQLFIDPRQTRGLDLDRQSGDDGLRIAIEPRNSAGEFVPAAGKVSVVLLDPSRQGEDARVGRWELEPDYVQYQLRLSGQRNIPLELPWTEQKPQSSRLQLHVRLETADGQQVEASRDVNVLLPGQISSRWTPRPAQRRGPLGRQSEIAAEQRKPSENVAQATHVEDAAETKPEETAARPSARPEWKPFR